MYIGCAFNETSPNFTTNVLSFNYTEVDDKMASIPHAHQYTEIMMVLDGVGELMINNKKRAFEKGILYIINPNTEHTEFQKKDLKYFVIKLQNFIVFSSNNECSVEEIPLDNKVFADLSESLLSVAKELRSDMPYKEEIARELLTGIYFKFLRIAEGAELLIKKENERRSSSRVKEIIDYISGNATKDLNIENIAHSFSISQNSLIRQLKKHTGYSPKQFIMLKRIAIAKEKLRNTNHTTTEIATICAFSDAAYFAKQFKKYVGLTPLEYRRQNAKLELEL